MESNDSGNGWAEGGAQVIPETPSREKSSFDPIKNLQSENRKL